MNKADLTNATPVQIEKEIKKWKSLAAQHEKRWLNAKSDETANRIANEVESIAEYLDTLELLLDGTNAEIKAKREESEIACVEELNMSYGEEETPETVDTSVVEEEVTTIDVTPEEVPIAEPVEEEHIVTKAKKSAANKQKRKENKQKANAKEVKEILERNELMKRKHVSRKVGEKKKGDWKQVSFRIKDHWYEPCKQHFRGEMDNGMKPTGIALSYGAESCVLGDFFNQRWFQDDRYLQGLKRFVKAAESLPEDLSQIELKCLQDTYAEMGLNTDEKKHEFVSSYKRIINFIEQENLYQYRDEAAELKQRRTDADVRVATSELMETGLKAI